MRSRSIGTQAGMQRCVRRHREILQALSTLGHNADKSVALCDELVLSTAGCDKLCPLF